MTERLNIDGTLKDLFQKDRPTLLTTLARGRRVKAFFNVELPKVQDRRVDLLILLDDDTILHVELQSTNDSRIVFRMGHYYLLLKERYGLPVRQVVLYLGSARMAMPDRVEGDGNRFTFETIDIREFDALAMAETGRPADLALAILAGGADERLTEILRCVMRLKGPARQRLIAQILVLAGLRGRVKQVEWELTNMSGVVIDIRKNPFLLRLRDEAIAQGKAEGMALLLQEQLETKFGPLPRWARPRIAKASQRQLEGWARKVLKATSVEGVLGPR